MHVIETLGRGGAERNLVNVLRALPRGEHAVCYLHPPGDYEAELREVGVPVRCLGMERGADLGRALQALSTELRRGDFQLLFTQIWLADVVGRIAGAMAQVPVISAVQTSAYEPETLATYSPAGRLKTRVYTQTLDALTARLFMRRFIAASEFSGGQIGKRLGVAQGRVTVVPNSVELSRFRPVAPAERRQLREELGLQPSDRVLISVGKMNRGKGNDLLIRAMPRVLARAPRCQLWLLGVGPDQDALQRLAGRCGVDRAVRFLGLRTDVERYLWAADLFVFASRFEGMPLAVLEAMACGLPCAVSDIPPHREISGDGEVAFLVREGAEAWADAILRLLEDTALSRELGQAALERTTARYNARAIARSLDAIFQAEARPSRWQRPGGTLADWVAASSLWEG
jgi:glycosyltransferase involved in cell wall biosynthesis